MAALRVVKVTYSDGSVIETSMSGKLSDEEIREYFKIGKVFNIGNIIDNMQSVVSCIIIL